MVFKITDSRFLILINLIFCLFSYELALDSDAEEFGGHKRLEKNQSYQTYPEGYAGRMNHIPVYIPSRTVIVLKPKTN